MENQEIAWLLKEKYKGVESEAFHADVARLRAGEPLAYLIGHTPFLDCTIYLDSHPLIPRVETEFWVEQAIKIIDSSLREMRGRANDEAIQSNSTDPGLLRSARNDEERTVTKYIKILDLCAGSGAIGVAVTKAIAVAHVTFAEIDLAHLPTIKKNLQENLGSQYSNRMEYLDMVQSDLFENISGTFDFILTNPPYIDAIANTVDQNVAEFEPHLALFGGLAGMEIIARIVEGARAKLVPQTGQLWIEHEPFQTDAITILAKANNFKIITHLDQYNVPRFSVLTV
jgi:release factor glutamine methyltransferase